MSEQFVLRPAIKEDLPFIFSTWLRSYKFSSQFARRLSNEIYYSNHHKIIEHILERASVLVACGPDNGPIFGYLVYEPSCLHFGYTKKSFRGLGIFTSLLAATTVKLDGLTFTHLTDSMNKIWDKNPTMRYNVYYV